MIRVTAHVFNVDHGDSTVVAIQSGSDDPRWVVIDTNLVTRNGVTVCPAFEFLRNRGVGVIDLMIVTHLHADHYSGADLILDNFTVRKLAIPPFLSQRSETVRKNVFRKYKQKILDTADRAGDSGTINSQLSALASLLNFIISNEDVVEEVSGPETLLRIPACSDVQLTAYLPLRREKGILIQRILDDEFELDWFPEMNDSSVVVGLDVHGHRLLWGADATLRQWTEHKRRMKRDGVECLGASVVKIPHHGSRHNNEASLWRYLFAPPLVGRTAIVSANGISHPHSEFFRIIADEGLLPYCTNLSSRCAESDLFSIEGLAGVKSALQPFLVHANAHHRPQPCQGDITLVVTAEGLKLHNSTGGMCVYEPGVVRSRLVVLR